MTERIYYTDPGTHTFDAVVSRAFDHAGRPAVVLDRTAFYPTSGGQPFDTGTLNGVAVLDTIDAGDDIIHVLADVVSEGTRVEGRIEWARRFDHMQQHTGQHVLSAAFERTSGNATVSFHLGGDTATIDLAREATGEEVARAEDEANRIVWDDREVRVRFASPAEAAALPLRKEPAREGTLRLVEVDAFDLSACGGTHVSRTGAIGLIGVLATERLKGGTRVTFVCGGRALRALRVFRHTVSGSIRLLSVLPAELPDAIERLQGEAREQRRALKDAREQLALHEARGLLDGAASVNGVRVTVRVAEGWDAAGLKAMAAAAVAGGGAVVGLFTAGEPSQVVIARSPDVALDAGALLRLLTTEFGGKGGGKPDLAQGGGLKGDLRQIAWRLSGLIEERLK
jgi:alanyl-tRNA synthetase